MKRVQATLEQYKDKIVEQLKDRLNQEKLVASGRLRDSIYGVVTETGINIFAQDYGIFVEEGREKGKAPLDTRTGGSFQRILDWVKTKNIESINPKYKRPRDVAWMIARSIGAEGTIKRFGYQGSKFIDFVSKNIMASLTKDIEESYLKDLNEQINGNTKT
jgi:hypothetical protein